MNTLLESILNDPSLRNKDALAKIAVSKNQFDTWD